MIYRIKSKEFFMNQKENRFLNTKVLKIIKNNMHILNLEDVIHALKNYS